MIRICLADDEAEFLALMKGLLENYLAEKAVLCEIDAYENPEPLYWEFLEKREYDICFLDIEMPQMDGRELAEKIRKLSDSTNIVFLTSHKEFIKAGYRVRAFDFITKDMVREEIPDVLDRLLQKLERDEQKFYTIWTHSRYEKIPYHDIICIYKQNQNVRFVLKAEEKQERKAIRKVLEELDGNGFLLVERGCIVNLEHIDRINARQVILSNGSALTISKEHIQEVRERLGMYCANQAADRQG